jgi:hypothetical protein
MKGGFWALAVKPSFFHRRPSSEAPGYECSLLSLGALYLDAFEQPARNIFSSILPAALSLIPMIVSALNKSANREILCLR